MTKTRKLSTLFLSTIMAGVMAPQVAIAENSAQDYYNQAETHFQQKEFKQALEDLNRAIQINPNYADAYLNRGSLFLLQGNQKKAIEDLENLATLYKQQGQIEKYQRVQQMLDKLR